MAPKRRSARPSDATPATAPKARAIDRTETSALTNDAHRSRNEAEAVPGVYTVRGAVRTADGVAAVGLTVAAFDHDIGGANPLGEALTTESGYRIAYDASAFRRSPRESRGPDIFLRVLDSAGDLLLETKPKRNAPQDFVVDLTIPRDYVIRGRVVDSNLRPMPGFLVRAVRKTLRKELPLGSAVSGEEGEFAVRYGGEASAHAGAGRGDLVLRVFHSNTRDRKCLSEKILLGDMDRKTKVELVVPVPQETASEWERIASGLLPLLRHQGKGDDDLRFEQLTLKDVPSLARESRIGDARLRDFVSAHAMARQFAPEQKKRKPRPESALPPEFFYGLLCGRGGQGELSVEQLAALPRADAERSVQWSLSKGLVPPKLKKLLPALMDDWDQQRAPLAARLPNRSALASSLVLKRVGKQLAAPVVERALLLAARSGGLDEGVIDQLAQDDALSTRQRNRLPVLRSAVIYAGLSREDPQLSSAFLSVSPKLPALTRADDVVRLARPDWQRVAQALERAQPSGRSGSAAVEERATALMRQFDSRFLGEAAAHRIASGEISVPPAARRMLSSVLKSEPEVKLGGSAGSSLAHALRGEVSSGRKATPAATELLKLDAFLRAADSTFDVADLQRAGYDSVAAVVDRGRAAFVEALTSEGDDTLRQPWSEKRANEVYDRFTLVAKNGALAAAGLLAFSNSPAVAALGDTKPGSVGTVAGLAFNRPGCACESCRSVLGQSAYLADLLNFLRDAPPTAGKSPLDVLLVRRPDLQETVLGCGNEQAELSYVDLVNEVLERAISGPMILAPQVLASAFAAALDAGNLPQTLHAELVAAGVHLTQHLTVERVSQGERWRVRDDRWIIDLRNRGAYVPIRGRQSFFGVEAAPWPQSEEASAVTAKSEPVRLLPAYETVAAAVFPWHLPFDLPQATTRQILEVRRITEVELRSVLGQGTADEAAAAAALARLNLSPWELNDAQSGAPPTEAEIARRWGFNDVNKSVDDPSPQYDKAPTRPKLTGWKSIAARLSFFMEIGRLSFDELQAVLRCGFVNPAENLRVASVDPTDPLSCDLRKLKLDNATPARFLAIYRFVRLHRTTGLPFADLDRLLIALDSPTLEWKDLLVRLGLALGVHQKLSLTIEELALFWTSIGTRSYLDLSSNPPRSVPSQYDAVFRNPTALAALIPENPASGWPTFDALSAALPEALGVGAASFDACLEACGLTRTTPASLDRLSLLYRHVLLARALGASIDDYGEFLKLMAEGPFGPHADPSRVDRFVRSWRAFQSLSLPMEMLSFVLLPGVMPSAVAVELGASAVQLERELSTVSSTADREQVIARVLSSLSALDLATTLDLTKLRLTAPSDRGVSPPLSVMAFLDDHYQNGRSPLADSAYSALVLVKKAGLVIKSAKLSREHWNWALAPASPTDWLDVNSLPVKVAGTAQPFESCERLVQWMGFWSALRTRGADVEALFAAIGDERRADVHSALAAALDTTVLEVDLLLGTGTATGPWSTAFPVGYWDPALFERLAQATAVARRLQVPASQIPFWFPAPDRPFAARLLKAEEVKTVLLAGLDPADRSRVRTEQERRLRDQCREALVAVLLHRHNVATTGELLALYLIDVEMSAKQKSRRIAQAVFATQLFVQRMLLGLEPEAKLPENEADEWNRWRKWYRVWEANRKVFLYPENWVEPEFRDDKSQFFRELESDLQQSDLTNERALIAFGSYLEKFGQIGNLEVVSFLDVAGDSGRTVTHLFARTRHGPVSYFYRQRIKDFRWTAWERIEADVEGDFLIPVVHGKRLQLVWAIVSEGESSDSGQQWKLQFARSRRTESGWRAKELIGAPMTPARLPGKAATESFVFRTTEEPDGDVRIHSFVAVESATPTNPALFADLKPRSSSDISDTFVTLKLVYRNRHDLGIPGVTAIATAKWDTRLPAAEPFPPSLRILGTTNAEGEITFFLPKNERRAYRLVLNYPPKNPPDATWNFDLGDPAGPSYTGYGPTPRTIEPLLWLEGVSYLFITVPIIVDIDAPAIPIDPSRAVDWDPLQGLKLTASGSAEPSSPSADLALEPPAHTAHFGMGYRPRSGVIHLSSDVASNGVIAVADTETRLLGSAQDSGLTKPLLPSNQHHPDLGFADILGVTTSKASFLADVSERPGYFGVIFGSVQLYALHFPRSAALIRAWDHGQFVGLANPEVQSGGTASDTTPTITNAGPTVPVVQVPEGVEFDLVRPSAVYSWEVFFHVPWLIAARLSENKRYADSQRWFHTIFDPTVGYGQASTSPGLDAWRCRPLREALAKGETLFDLLADRVRLEAQVIEWESHPFQPHALARYRLRSYAIAILKSYIENLLAWGNDIARRNTLEAVNEATQLFVLAQELLGHRPASAMHRPGTQTDTFSRLVDFDPLSNPAALVAGAAGTTGGNTGAPAVPDLNLRYFCIPPNDELLDLWARVEASLLRVRSGMAGSLFGPPIDPALLVRAAALGLDISDLLAGLTEPPMPYRYAFTAQKALQFCGEVRSLGGAMLAAIEKRDTEKLSLLRSTHERKLAKMQHDIRKAQAKEALAQIATLRASRQGAGERLLHFRKLLGQSDLTVPAENTRIPRVTPITARSTESHFDVDVRQLGLSRREVAHLNWAVVANNYSMTASSISSMAAAAHFLPTISWATTTGSLPPLTTTVTTSFTGDNIGKGLSAISTSIEALAANASLQATASATVGGHERRRDDWAYQHNVIAAEIEQIDKQIAAAEIRHEIAEAERAYQETVSGNAEEVEQYLRSKFSSEQLYHWMIRQLAGCHFRAYQVALELAKAAQTALNRELAPLSPLQFIQPGYWDSLREGLLAGEQLSVDLMRMDAEYMRLNGHELELTKHVSLASIDPLALVRLKLTGSCEFKIPEVIFDLDFPGHYLRRIKSVSVSVPCVVAPYSGVPATLKWKKSFTRSKPLAGAGGLVEDAPPATTKVAISSAQSDTGLFEVGLRDERYLPFEGAGIADSEWAFDLAKDFRPFDYETISDVILHVRYTARADDNLQTAVRAKLKTALNAYRASAQMGAGVWRQFSLRHEYPMLWNALLEDRAEQRIMELDSSRFGALLRDSTLDIQEIQAIASFARNKQAAGSVQLSYNVNSTPRTIPIAVNQPFPDAEGNSLKDVLKGTWSAAPPTEPIRVTTATLSLAVKPAGVNVGDLEDLFICARVTVA